MSCRLLDWLPCSCPRGRRSCCPRPRILTCWLKTAPHFSLLPPFLPVMMFAILFGLSMDYEVFLLSRIREAFLGQAQPGEAVVDGVARTANVITAAAAIMVAVFGAFVLCPDLNLKLVGVGLASAILIDATIVRMLLVPATMELLGARSWWMPRWLDRVVPQLEVEPEPARA